jgi:ElaB/YqjD/DUF883 family membrane-anchored ribosome-binding protein
MSHLESRQRDPAAFMSAITRNPEGLLLLGAGLALLLRSGSNQSSRMGSRVGEALHRAGDYASDATEHVSEAAQSYMNAAADYAGETTRAAVENSQRAIDQARETADRVSRDQPWTVALAGLVAGVAIAAAIPPTRVERRTLGEVGGRLKSAAANVGDRLMEAGVQAKERLSEIAEERGLTKDGLKEAAQDVQNVFSSSLSGEEQSAPRGDTRQAHGERQGDFKQDPANRSGGRA